MSAVEVFDLQKDADCARFSDAEPDASEHNDAKAVYGNAKQRT